jgi:hypothetical protein
MSAIPLFIPGLVAASILPASTGEAQPLQKVCDILAENAKVQELMDRGAKHYIPGLRCR